MRGGNGGDGLRDRRSARTLAQGVTKESVKRMLIHVLCLTLAGGLLLLLGTYAFVENFRIVAR